MPSFEEGSLVLKDADGRYFRLSWERPEESADGSGKEEEQADGGRVDPRRALPPGSYTLTSYRIIRRDEDRRQWFLSASSGHGIRKIEIQQGREHAVGITDKINMVCRTRLKGGELFVSVGITGEPHSGLSIYLDGKRIPVNYTVTSADGKVLSSGPMKYG